MLKGIFNRCYFLKISKEALHPLQDWLWKTFIERAEKTIKHISFKRASAFSFLSHCITRMTINSTLPYRLISNSNITTKLEIVNFKIIDKKSLNRTVIQDKLLEPIKIYSPMMTARHNSNVTVVYFTDRFTLLKDQVLEIEVQRKWRRHQKSSTLRTGRAYQC